ncbi:MAG: hypothetical protein JXQ29_18115 [Planctomycetes bacterium]|nr:hypothetical protein [Planctomycetota bacterium]
MIDLHAHVLPAVDDGPRELDGALALLERLAADGVTDVVATPHMLDGRFDVTPARLRTALAALRAAAQEAAIGVVLHPGAEVVAQAGLEAMVRDGTAVTLAGGGRYLLVETSFHAVPPELDRLVFALALEGVTAILAHPERILEVQRRPDSLAPRVAAGLLLQVNASSLTGDGGEGPRDAAFALLDRGLVHLVASDAHDVHHRPPRLAAAQALLRARVGEREADALLRGRPEQVLRGAVVETPRDGRPALGRGRARRLSWWRRARAAM